MTPEKVDRNRQLVQLYDEGNLSYREIGQQYNLHHTAVLRIYHRWKAREKRKNKKLSTGRVLTGDR